ncbi:MAG: hypothetical protein LIP03_14370 [Bacteroidales bacterium]|nr:hypothetical protein [Bacteroidales bacterium]
MKLVNVFIMMVVWAAMLTTADARTWRVNPNPNAGAEYTNISDLNNNYEFQAGDTILCDAGNYGEVTVQRDSITIMGPGYFKGLNTDWSETGAAYFSTLTTQDNSKMIGLEISTINAGGSNEIYKCKVYQDGKYYVSNLLVHDCYITGWFNQFNYGTFFNNIFVNGGIRPFSGSTPSDIFNNVFIFESTSNLLTSSIIANSRIYNNIIINTSNQVDSSTGAPYCNNVIDFDHALSNNIAIFNNVFSIVSDYANENFPNNLYVGATVENTFVNSGALDAMYMLKEGSPAIGAASDGGDCGAFGGPEPYILSGIPAFMPQITEAYVSSKPTDGKINVKLTITTQNE